MVMRTRRGALLLILLAAVAYGQPAQRIVSTAPSITELLYALGLGDRVVGVDRFSRYPVEALRKPKIGDYANPNLEAIAALRPDLVIIPTNPVKLADRLGLLRLRVRRRRRPSSHPLCNPNWKLSACARLRSTRRA
jgi:ABC-type hemin transport system substrate-binding protein